jgi:hypothetical protein
MLEHVEQQLVLPEYLNIDSDLIILALLGQFLHEPMSLTVQQTAGSGGFAKRGGDEEELLEVGSRLDHALDVFLSDGVVAEVVEDRKGRVDFLVVARLQWLEQLASVLEVALLKKLRKLGVAQSGGFFRHHIPAGFNDLQHGFVDAEETAVLGRGLVRLGQFAFGSHMQIIIICRI